MQRWSRPGWGLECKVKRRAFGRGDDDRRDGRWLAGGGRGWGRATDIISAYNKLYSSQTARAIAARHVRSKMAFYLIEATLIVPSHFLPFLSRADALGKVRGVRAVRLTDAKSNDIADKPDALSRKRWLLGIGQFSDLWRGSVSVRGIFNGRTQNMHSVSMTQTARGYLLQAQKDLKS